MKHTSNTLLVTTSLLVLSLSFPALADKDKPITGTDRSKFMSYAEKADVQILSRADVKRIQESLSYYNYDTGPHDGILGPRTNAALREFQKNNNLTPDGIIRTSTLEKLNINVSSLDNYVPVSDMAQKVTDSPDYNIIEPASGMQEYENQNIHQLDNE